MENKVRNSSLSMMNSRGLIATDFIFALVLCIALSIVLFTLNFTLSMAEVAQYIAFSSSRAHAAAHINIEDQKRLGEKKYTELINNPVLKPLFNNPDGGWFRLTGFEIRSGGLEGNNFADDYPKDENRVPQVGVRFKFIPKVLDRRILFLGSTSESSDDEAFSANITGMLIREPTQKECETLFLNKRYDLIINLDPRFALLAGRKKDRHFPMEDNGC